MSALERFSLRDKVIVLTGGAGHFGRQFAAAIAAAGAKLVIAARNVSELEKIAALEMKRGHVVFCEPLDQGEEKSVLDLCDRIIRQFGRVDGLVNNSVARPMQGPDDPVSAWDASMRVNAT